MTKDNSQIIDATVHNLLDMFQSGDFPAQLAFSIIRKHEGDIIPSDSWSFGNIGIMLAHSTQDARGFQQWAAVDRHVIKGRKAFHIFAPLTRKVKETDSITGEVSEKIIIFGFRPIPVFRYEDTDGAPLPSFDYTPKTFPPFFDVASKLNISVEYRPLLANFLGRFSKNSAKIQLCSQDAFVYYHELSHAVNSTFADLNDDPDKAEIVAEFSAAVLASLTGFNGYECQAFHYIQHYCNDFSNDAVLKKILSVLSDVQKIVSIILDTTNDSVTC